MESEREGGGDLALKLATEVLKRKMSYDEGLIRAQTNHTLEAFIDGLNVLVGRELFHLEAAQKRLRTGAAERAIKGEESLLDLPPELNGWTLEGEHTKPPLDAEVFGPWELQAAKYAADRDEARSHLELVEKSLRQSETISAPWVAPATLLGITVALTAILQFVVHSVVGAGIALVIGSFLCLSVFQKEFKRYESESRRVYLETQRRLEKRTKLLELVNECERGIEALRDKARETLENSAPLPEEKRAEFFSQFPNLFPQA